MLVGPERMCKRVVNSGDEEEEEEAEEADGEANEDFDANRGGDGAIEDGEHADKEGEERNAEGVDIDEGLIDWYKFGNAGYLYESICHSGSAGCRSNSNRRREG